MAKFTLWQAMKTRSGSKGIALLFLEPRHWMLWVVKAMSRLFYPVKETQYLLHKKFGGPQGRSGMVRKISPALVFDRQTLQSVVSPYTDCSNRTQAKLEKLTLRRLMSYIYDISSLKVNNLTLILLTWRKW